MSSTKSYVHTVTLKLPVSALTKSGAKLAGQIKTEEDYVSKYIKFTTKSISMLVTKKTINLTKLFSADEQAELRKSENREYVVTNEDTAVKIFKLMDLSMPHEKVAKPTAKKLPNLARLKM